LAPVPARCARPDEARAARLWAWLDLTARIQHWDLYPFILMSLFLSLQAAYTAPMPMMSQNRLAAQDEALAARLNGSR